jgi:hypothetical protein
MKTFPLRSDRVSLAVTETGGQLSEVAFVLADGRTVAPMHVAPWADETLGDDIPPMLRVLRGDFLAAPFGASDVLPGEGRDHGLAANGTWRLAGHSESALDATLTGTIMGATLDKHVELRAGESVVYQRHTFTGGSGRLPVGHHAMLRADTPLKLGFAPWTVALTPPKPVETPPHGRPLLAPNQTIRDLTRAERADGGTADLTQFPSADGYEALWMLVSDPVPEFAWTTATAPARNWVWFSLKKQRTLPQTLLWFSNGGRDYPPWNGRHRLAIGIEEICGYFHLGHAASVAVNPVAAGGSATAMELAPNGQTVLSYIFGLAATPPGFGAVTDVIAVPGGIRLADAAGHAVFAACDLSFVTAN